MTTTKEDHIDLENSFSSTSHIIANKGKLQGRCKRCTTLVCSTVGVVFVLLAYVICGAIVFSNLEGTSYAKGGNEDLPVKKETEVVSLGVQDQLRVAKAIRQQTVEKLWEITEKLNILYKDNWTALADREMVKFQTQLFAQKKDSHLEDEEQQQQLQVLQTGSSAASFTKVLSDDKITFQDSGSSRRRNSESNLVQQQQSRAEIKARNHEEWSFSQSFLYSLTLITTVGHSKKVPESPAGKIVAIVVVSLGLPLLLIYLSLTGSGLARIAKKIYSILCCCTKKKQLEHNQESLKMSPAPMTSSSISKKCRNCYLKSSGLVPGISSSSDNLQAGVPLWVCLLIILCYISAGATVFCAYHEDWSFVDSFFFAFSVLWTIGMMDKSTSDDGTFVILCTLYLLLGLAIVAMCVHLLCNGHFPLWTLFKSSSEKKAEMYHSSWVYNETPS